LVGLAADRPDQDGAGATSLPAAPPVTTATTPSSATVPAATSAAPLEDVFHPSTVILRTMRPLLATELQSKRKGFKPALYVWRGRGWEAETITIHDND
jgi:hypothetical protein